MKRIFIAIKINPDKLFMKMLNTFKSALSKDNIKWIDTENIHITLAFLGNTENDLIWDIESMLEKVCGDSANFELVIRGTGVFRNLNDPRIIWSNVDHSEELVKLAHKIQSELKQMKIKLDEKPFKPHITIGRIKHPGNKEILKQITEQYQAIELQKIHVNEVILYESILLEHGPKYVPLGKYLLNQ